VARWQADTCLRPTLGRADMEWWPDRAGRQHLRDSYHDSHRARSLDRLEANATRARGGGHIGDTSLRSIQESSNATDL